MTDRTRALSDKRLAQIRGLPTVINHHAWSAALDASDAIRDLIAELDRTRAAFAELQAATAHDRKDEPMTDHREFPLADALSITTPNLLSRRHMDGIVDLVNWMRGSDFRIIDGKVEIRTTAGVLLTDESRTCRLLLREQHPFLVELQPPAGLDAPDLYTWLIHAERQHGETISVRRP
jgi:hypothetical protein